MDAALCRSNESARLREHGRFYDARFLRPRRHCGAPRPMPRILKLSSATVANSAAYIRAAQTKGPVIDIRNFPEFVIDSLGSLLVSQAVDFARATGRVSLGSGAWLYSRGPGSGSSRTGPLVTPPEPYPGNHDHYQVV